MKSGSASIVHVVQYSHGQNAHPYGMAGECLHFLLSNLSNAEMTHLSLLFD